MAYLSWIGEVLNTPGHRLDRPKRLADDASTRVTRTLSPTEVPRTIDIAFQCLSMIGESGFYVRRHTIDSFSLSSRCPRRS